jgi:hypothetical protein
MDRFFKLLLVSAGVLWAGHAAAQTPAVPRINNLQLKTAPLVAPAANPVRLAPGVVVPLDAEAQVQAEIKRQQKKRDDISAALAKVGANFSKLTFTPATGNSCVDPDTTWNPRSGESFACIGMTTCIGRMSRWSKNRFNPCEPGVVIDSCVISDECKSGSLCDVGAKTCVRTR